MDDLNLDVPYPPLARLIFRELDGGPAPTRDELPAGIDRLTYEWVRELVKRLRAKARVR